MKFLLSFVLLLFMQIAIAAPPPITGVPVIDKPQVLEWPRDRDMGLPDLTEATSNRLFDLHGSITNCDGIDLAFSTAGNYHMALREMWNDVLLANHSATIKSWYYSTSPPVLPQQIVNKNLVFGNFALKCPPQVVVGPKALLDTLVAGGFIDLSSGPVVKIWNNRGNVILVKKGNPKNIHTVWDLRRHNVTVVTPHPATEKSSFDNYSGTIFAVAEADTNPPTGWDATRLFNSIFNAPTYPSWFKKHKWVSGERIHHREVPWSIAYGEGDATVIFYHLALYMTRTFPDQFEIVPLGGTAENPQPLPGNTPGAHFAGRVVGTWTTNQSQARERLMESLTSEQFKVILESHGLARP